MQYKFDKTLGIGIFTDSNDIEYTLGQEAKKILDAPMHQKISYILKGKGKKITSDERVFLCKNFKRDVKARSYLYEMDVIEEYLEKKANPKKRGRKKKRKRGKTIFLDNIQEHVQIEQIENGLSVVDNDDNQSNNSSIADDVDKTFKLDHIISIMELVLDQARDKDQSIFETLINLPDDVLNVDVNDIITKKYPLYKFLIPLYYQLVNREENLEEEQERILSIFSDDN